MRLGVASVKQHCGGKQVRTLETLLAVAWPLHESQVASDERYGDECRVVQVLRTKEMKLSMSEGRRKQARPVRTGRTKKDNRPQLTRGRKFASTNLVGAKLVVPWDHISLW